MKTGAFRNITISCFLSTLHSFLESQSSQHIAKATFSKTWWSLSKMKPSSSSYMTKMVRARARMCCRTYRGRWPSGFSQSTCHLPKALLYETSGPGVFPGTCQFGCYVGFPWTYTSHLASVFGWAKELPQLPQLLLTKQMQLPWAPVEKGRTCHWLTDQSAPGSRGRRPWGSHADLIWKPPGAVEHPLPRTSVQWADWELKVIQVPDWQLENFTVGPWIALYLLHIKDLSSCSSIRVNRIANWWDCYQ